MNTTQISCLEIFKTLGCIIKIFEYLWKLWSLQIAEGFFKLAENFLKTAETFLKFLTNRKFW